jgi:hypothetical protein
VRKESIFQIFPQFWFNRTLFHDAQPNCASIRTQTLVFEDFSICFVGISAIKRKSPSIIQHSRTPKMVYASNDAAELMVHPSSSSGARISEVLSPEIPDNHRRMPADDGEFC